MYSSLISVQDLPNDITLRSGSDSGSIIPTPERLVSCGAEGKQKKQDIRILPFEESGNAFSD